MDHVFFSDWNSYSLNCACHCGHQNNLPLLRKMWWYWSQNSPQGHKGNLWLPLVISKYGVYITAHFQCLLVTAFMTSDWDEIVFTVALSFDKLWCAFTPGQPSLRSTVSHPPLWTLSHVFCHFFLLCSFTMSPGSYSNWVSYCPLGQNLVFRT
jgi:hypothetical protein